MSVRSYTWDQRRAARNVVEERIANGELDEAILSKIAELDQQADKETWELTISVQAKTNSGYIHSKHISFSYVGSKKIAISQATNIPKDVMRDLIAAAMEDYLGQEAKGKVIDEAVEYHLGQMFPEPTPEPIEA